MWESNKFQEKLTTSMDRIYKKIETKIILQCMMRKKVLRIKHTNGKLKTNEAGTKCLHAKVPPCQSTSMPKKDIMANRGDKIEGFT